MILLEDIEIEYLDSAMLIAFFYSDDTISWILIDNGEITKRLVQKPRSGTGNLAGLCGREEGN